MGFGDEVESLVQEMDRDVDAAIVEGRKDKEALQKAGFTGKIYKCSENSNGMASFSRKVGAENSSVSILTDFDSEGRSLCGSLRDSLPEKKVHRIWRRKLGKLLTVNGRRDVESINNILGR